MPFLFENTRNQTGYSRCIEFYTERMQSAGKKRNSQKEEEKNNTVMERAIKGEGKGDVKKVKKKKNPPLNVPLVPCNP